MYESSPLDNRDGFDFYSAQASFARPRTTLARRLSAFFGFYISLAKSAGLASLAGKASLVSIPDASLRDRRKKGRGREKRAKEGKRESPSFFPSSLSPTLSTPTTQAS